MLGRIEALHVLLGTTSHVGGGRRGNNGTNNTEGKEGRCPLLSRPSSSRARPNPSRWNKETHTQTVTGRITDKSNTIYRRHIFICNIGFASTTEHAFLDIFSKFGPL
jgi:hypothetical protein